MKVMGYAEADPHVPPVDPDYLFDRNTTLAILAGFAFNRRVMVQGYHGTGKSTHIEQVAARLNWPLVRVNLDAHVSPYRSRRQGRDRPQGRQADHRVPRRHPALGGAEQYRAGLRRIRRRPPGRDVRDPARARIVGPADAARPEPRHHPAPGVPPVLDDQHHRSRRYVGPLSRHPADQSGPDGPLVDRDDAQLSAARQGSRHRSRQGQGLPEREGQEDRRQHGAARRSHALGLHQWRPLDRDEPAHGDHLGRECRRSSATSALPSG